MNATKDINQPDNVKVALEYDTDTKLVSLKISLRSDKKLNLWASVTIPLNENNFALNIDRSVDQLVKHLGLKYQDNLNPDECIKLVRQATREVLEKAQNYGQSP